MPRETRNDRNSSLSHEDIERIVTHLLEGLKEPLATIYSHVHGLKELLAGLATEKTQTALLNRLEGLSQRLITLEEKIDKLDTYIRTPSIVLTPRKPDDKELST